MKDYLKINKNSWNQKVSFHLDAPMYDMPNFMAGHTSLKDIEIALFGDVKGKKILHLQCHFGQDSISLSRMGASVVGVDFSEVAITTARKLCNDTQTDTKFICCDIYDLANHLAEKFDIVFTSYGVIGWLPDLNKWADIIQHFLKKEGKLIFVEFHPVLWMMDDKIEHVAYAYFNEAPIVESYEGTYANKQAPIKLDYVMWNHHLGEVFKALLSNGMHINSFDEFDYSPYDILHNSIKVGESRYRAAHHGNKIPLTYAIVAEKK